MKSNIKMYLISIDIKKVTKDYPANVLAYNSINSYRNKNQNAYRQYTRIV